MKQGIIYILMSIFLLFIAESKNYVDFQYGFGNQSSNYQISKLAKKHYDTFSLDKSFSQHYDNSLNVPEELKTNAFQYSNLLQGIAVISLLGLGYIFNLIFLKRKNHFFTDVIRFSLSTRTFILFQSIRI